MSITIEDSGAGADRDVDAVEELGNTCQCCSADRNLYVMYICGYLGARLLICYTTIISFNSGLFRCDVPLTVGRGTMGMGGTVEVWGHGDVEGMWKARCTTLIECEARYSVWCCDLGSRQTHHQ